MSQPAKAQADDDLSRWIRDWMHYVIIDQREAAESVGQNIVARLETMTPEQWVAVVDDLREKDKFEDAIARAKKRGGAQEAQAGRMDSVYNTGKTAIARSPAQVTSSIKGLTQEVRHRLLAHQRLEAAGEYAMPQLLEAYLQRGDLVLRNEAFRVMVKMGRHTQQPLMAALPELDEASQTLVVEVLGNVGYRTCLPTLIELRETSQDQLVQEACQRAIVKITNGQPQGSAAVEYRLLADSYYREKAELTSFPNDEHQIVWTYNRGIGLLMTPVRTEVYHEAMTMKMAEKSLSLSRAGNSDALTLWISANFRREVETPAGYANPLYSASRRDPMYWAVAAGPDVARDVLNRAIADSDTPIVRRALSALDQTGGRTLTEGAGASALGAALRYPNRRVRYDAALTVAHAMPTGRFPGAELVTELLASATNDAGTQYALILASDREVARGHRTVLEALGFKVLPEAASLSDVLTEINDSPSVDLLVTSLSSDATVSTIEDARRSSKLSATPIVALAERVDLTNLSNRYSTDIHIEVRSRQITAGQLGNTVIALVERASGGPLGGDEARNYADRALSALQDIAVSRSDVFRISDAGSALLQTLGGSNPDFRTRAGEILSWINDKSVQVALFDSALNSPGAERFALMRSVADSARRFGNLLEPRQIRQLTEMARDGQGEEATAAAALMGSLNLPNEDLVPLILEQR